MSYTPIILHTALLIMSKASRFHRSLIHRKGETLRQYITRAQAAGLWSDDITTEGVQVWLSRYEAVRFYGNELSAKEFLETMKLVHYLLMEMKPPAERDREDSEVSSSSSSGLFSSEEEEVWGDLARSVSIREGKMDLEVLRQMDTLLSTDRRRSIGSGSQISLRSVIDHGSVMDEIGEEERERRMRGGRLGQRDGSIIYYDVADD
jgi:hypothetical protein